MSEAMQAQFSAPSKWGAELEPYQMLSASSITMPIPTTSTASAIES